MINGIITEWLGGAPGKGIFFDECWHGGGDEVSTSCWSETPAVQQWMTQNNLSPTQTYLYFVNATNNMAIAQGRRPVRWNEVWNNFGTALDKRTIIHVWLSADVVANATSYGYNVIWSVDGLWYLDDLTVSAAGQLN